MTIDSFFGEKAFLDIDYKSKITWEKIEYTSVEHAFVAAITVSWLERIAIASVDGLYKAKQYAEAATIREDWTDEIKVETMRELNALKFKDSEMSLKLLSTGDEEIVKPSYTDATDFWGKRKDNSKGENHLGKILMEIRERIKTHEDMTVVNLDASEVTEQEMTRIGCCANQNWLGRANTTPAGP